MKIGKIDALGRVVIPSSFRKKLNLETDSKIIITASETSVIITPQDCICRLCSASIGKNSIIPLCKSCIKAIKNADVLG